MKQPQTAEGVEAEAARVRSQIVMIGADLRRHADPSAVLDTAKASFERRSEELPRFLKKNATPLSMLMLGGTFGVVLTGLLSPARSSKTSSAGVPDASARTQKSPPT